MTPGVTSKPCARSSSWSAMLDGPPQVGVALDAQAGQQMDEGGVGLAERVLRGATDRLDNGLLDIAGLPAHASRRATSRT
jgi:hypothetical protein